MPRYGLKLDLYNFTESVIDYCEKYIDEEERLELYHGDYDSDFHKISEYLLAFIYFGNIPKYFEKDLKVKFDFENTKVQGIYFTTENIPYAIIEAGGDWEHPIYFIIYPETKDKLRAYIPADGNTYHKKTMTAYGSEPDEEDMPETMGYSENLPQLNLELFQKDVYNRIRLKQ